MDWTYFFVALLWENKWQQKIEESKWTMWENSLLMNWNHVNYQKQLHSNEWKSISDEFINCRFFSRAYSAINRIHCSLFNPYQWTAYIFNFHGRICGEIHWMYLALFVLVGLLVGHHVMSVACGDILFQKICPAWRVYFWSEKALPQSETDGKNIKTAPLPLK